MQLHLFYLNFKLQPMHLHIEKGAWSIDSTKPAASRRIFCCKKLWV